MRRELSINDVVAITALAGDVFCGEQSPDNVALLAKAAKMIPPGGTYLEIGMRVGMSTLAVALANLDIQIVSVDKDRACGDHLSERIDRLCKAISTSGFRLKDGWMLRERIKFIWSDSVVAAKDWHEPIDFFFADGDHTYDGIRADIGAWLPFVKDNGIAAFHDYADDEAEMDGKPCHVSRAVHEAVMFSREWMLYESNFHLAVFRKINR